MISHLVNHLNLLRQHKNLPLKGWFACQKVKKMSIYDAVMNNGKDDDLIHRIHKEEDALYCLALKYQQHVF